MSLFLSLKHYGFEFVSDFEIRISNLVSFVKLIKYDPVKQVLFLNTMEDSDGRMDESRARS